jgi:hypothetical protein
VQQERHVAGVGVLVEMVDARGVERGGTPLDPMNGVAEAKQEFGEVGAVLPGDAGQQRHAPFGILRHHVHSNKGRRRCADSSSPPIKPQALRWACP